jgi:tetratricopeptide (TPR) repeat protein
MRDEYAFLLAGAGRKKEAEEVLNGTLAKAPKDAAALLWRTTLEVDRGAFDAAAKDVETLEGMKAFSGQLSYQKARILFAANQTAKAGSLLAEALQSNPRLLPARLDLARLLTANGNAKTAIEVLSKASLVEQNTTEFAAVRNVALMASGRMEEARRGVAALAAGKSAAFYYQDALLKVGSNDAAGAQKSLEAAFAIQPGAADTLRLLGDVMRMQGQTAKFEAMVRDAASRNPKSAALQLTLGRQLLAAGNYPGAEAAFRAAEGAGAEVEAEAALAGLETRQGKLDAARHRLLELARTHDSAAVRLQLGGIEERKGSAPAAAMEQYLKALQIEPQNVVAMNNLADCLARQNKLDDAKFWGEKALAAAPGNPVAEDTLGWIYYLRGKFDLALPLLEKSAHDSDRPVAHYHLGGVLARLGDTAGARKEYELGVKEDPHSAARASVGGLFEGRVQVAWR